MTAFTVATLVHCYNKIFYITSPSPQEWDAGMDRDGMEDLKTTLGHACSHCGISNLVLKWKIGHSGYIEQDLVYFVCCFCVTIQITIWYKSFFTLVTLERFHLSFHCRKWQRGVGDNWWALDWIWSVHPWRRFNLPFQEFFSSFSISPQSWRTGLLLLLWRRCSLLGVHGEGKGGIDSEGERESFALASQSLAEGQTLGCQRQFIFRSIGCRHFSRISELMKLLEQKAHAASSTQHFSFSHHQQGRIDFSTVNPSLSTGMDFLIHP